MRKGVLLEQTFNLKSPTADKDFENFTKQLGALMKKHKIDKYVALRREKSEDIIEIIVLPCNSNKGGEAQLQSQLAQLQAQGFEAATMSNANDLKNYGQSNIEPVAIQFKFGK